MVLSKKKYVQWNDSPWHLSCKSHYSTPEWHNRTAHCSTPTHPRQSTAHNTSEEDDSLWLRKAVNAKKSTGWKWHRVNTKCALEKSSVWREAMQKEWWKKENMLIQDAFATWMLMALSQLQMIFSCAKMHKWILWSVTASRLDSRGRHCVL